MGLGIRTAIRNRMLGSNNAPAPVAPQQDETPAQYWTRHNVTAHRRFASAEESARYFDWRNDQYPHYIALMPVKGFDGKCVLDYGCGPGHDLVGFGIHSEPSRLIGMDVSSSSLAEARDRLSLHGVRAEITQIDPEAPALPLDTASVDHIHSSGVLHHVPDPVAILKEMRRVLKPGGTMNVMVYNYDSIWLHLYVAYVKRIAEGIYADEPLRQAFRYTTDGPECPISNVYRPQEWIDICRASGFDARFKGAAVSLWECHLLQQHRFMACMQDRLPEESRKFLLDLTFDANGLPMWNGTYAGVDGCFALTPV